MLSGRIIWLYLAVLSAGLAALARLWWKLLKQLPQNRAGSVRAYFTVAGVGFSTVAVVALLLLHLSWLSAGISQFLGAGFAAVLMSLALWTAAAGLAVSAVGRGKLRWVGVGTSLLIGAWCFSLAIGAGIALGAVQVRRPVRYLIPQGYVGWVTVAHEYGPPLPIVNGKYVCRIPAEGVLHTQSPLEEGVAKDEYFYYSPEGALRPLPISGWGAGGLIWGNEVGWQQPEHGEKAKWAVERFYVGTEAQFRRGETKPADFMSAP